MKAPTWYTSEEMRDYLRNRNYSDEIADELSTVYAFNLQAAFNKGWIKATRTKTKLCKASTCRPAAPRKT